MSRRGRLQCSLPLASLILLGLAAAARSAEVALAEPTSASSLIDVKAERSSSTLPLHDASDGQTWTLVWSDLGVADEVAPSAGAAGIEQFVRTSVRPPQAPPIIAAPLPPALLSGLIGLAGVYAYKRRNRLG